MDALIKTRMQRLRTLENEIRTNFEGWVKTGFALKEIRDDHLFKEAGYKNWTEYQKKRLALEFGIEKTWSTQIIQAAVVRAKIRNHIHRAEQDEKTDWNIRSTLELARLAPKKEGKHGSPRDVESLNKNDVTRVAKKAIAEANKQKKPLTSTIVRKVVDADLGIDRSAKAKKTKEKRAEKPNLRDLVLRYKGQLDGIISNFASVPKDAWEILEADCPGLREDLAKACDDLATLMRSGWRPERKIDYVI